MQAGEPAELKGGAGLVVMERGAHVGQVKPCRNKVDSKHVYLYRVRG